MGYVHYDVTNGLPSNNVYSGLQDKLGYLWFATDKGVVKYNGYTFRTFGHNDSLPNEDVWRLFEDSSGRIWLHCFAHEFGYLKDDKYGRLALPFSDEMLKPLGQCALSGVNFVVFNNSRTPMVCKFIMENMVSIVDLNQVFQIDSSILFFDGIKNLYGYSEALNQFTSYNLENEKIEKFSLGSETLNCGAYYASMYRFGEFYAFLTRDCQRIVIFDKKRSIRMFMNVENEREVFRFVASSSDSTITAISTKAAYVLHVGSLTITSTKFNGINWIQNIAQSQMLSSPFCVFRKSIKSIFLKVGFSDEWQILGTHAHRIFFRDLQEEKIYYGDEAKNNYKVIANNYGSFRSIFKYDDYKVLVSSSTSEKLLNLQTAESRAWEHGRKKRIMHNALVRETVLKRNFDKYFYGIQCGMKFQGKIFYCESRRCGVVIDTGEVLSICVLQDDRYTHIVVDSFHHRALYYNPEKVSAYYYDKDSFVSLTLVDSSIRINEKIKKILPDGFGNIFIHTEKQLYLFDEYNLSLNPLNINCDVHDALVEIKQGKLIVGGRHGFAIANIQGRAQISSFKYAINLQDAYFKQMLEMGVTDYGELLIKTDKGFYNSTLDRIEDAAVSFNAQQPLFNFIYKNTSFRKIRQTDTIRADQSRLNLNFDAINLCGRGTLQYYYRIPGDNKGWQRSTTGDIFIGDLTPGKFYSVQFRLIDDLWRSDVYTVSLYRIPFWYQTKTARLIFWVGGTLLVTGLVLCIVLYTRYRVNRINAEKKRMLELELRAIHSQINPHFIFNTLSTAMAFISKKETNRAYEHVSKFSQLLRTYLKSSRDRFICLGDEIEMLRKYAELQQNRFEHKFEFEINVDNKIPVYQLQIPALLLQPIVENAINHGLFHKKDAGKLTISFEDVENGKAILCTIEDNGVGRKKAQELKAANSAKIKSYGSELTKDLIDIMANYEQMNIDLEYIDNTFPDTGTIVKLTIKNLKYVP